MYIILAGLGVGIGLEPLFRKMKRGRNALWADEARKSGDRVLSAVGEA